MQFLPSMLAVLLGTALSSAALAQACAPKVGFGIGSAAQDWQAGIDLVDQDLETFDQTFLRIFASDLQLGSAHEQPRICDQAAQPLHQFLFAPHILIALLQSGATGQDRA